MTVPSPLVGGPASTPCARAFQVNRDPRFLWLDEPYRDAFEALYRAVRQGCPLGVLTGGVGAGKTMLADAVSARLVEDGVVVGRLGYPSRDADDFWNAIADAFGLRVDGDGRDAVRTRFAELVQRAARTSTRVLLVIDEAQALTSAVLTEVLHAGDAARDAGAPNVLTVFLVGEDELDPTLARPELAALAVRIAVRRRLPALREREVAGYIRHRLACVGAPPDVFTPDALTATAVLSRGLPRLINMVCARAAARGHIVDAAIVERCAREMTWLADRRAHRARPAATSREVVVTGRRSRRRRVVVAALASAGVFVLAETTGEDGPGPSHRAGAAAPAAAVASRDEPARATPATPTLDDAAGDPDPSAIIEWLLNDRSRRTAISHR